MPAFTAAAFPPALTGASARPAGVPLSDDAPADAIGTCLAGPVVTLATPEAEALPPPPDHSDASQCTVAGSLAPSGYAVLALPVQTPPVPASRELPPPSLMDAGIPFVIALAALLAATQFDIAVPGFTTR